LCHVGQSPGQSTGGPFKFTATKPGKSPLGLEEAHRAPRISPAEIEALEIRRIDENATASPIAVDWARSAKLAVYVIGIYIASINAPFLEGIPQRI
jgi:hypothetical protein